MYIIIINHIFYVPWSRVWVVYLYSGMVINSFTGIYTCTVRTPILGLMTMPQIPCLDHGTYVYIDKHYYMIIIIDILYKCICIIVYIYTLTYYK